MITILDVAKAEGVKADAQGNISAGEFERVGLPFFCGCAECEASLAPYNAYPTKIGYTMCKDCVDNLGFKSYIDFKNWEAEHKGKIEE